MKIKVTDGVTKDLEAMTSRFDSIEDDVSRKSADWVASKLKDVIEQQKLPFAPRSANTRAGDPRVLIDTKAYVDGIEAKRTGNGEYSVVCDKQKRYFAEYGRKGQPPRPHWAPVLERFRKVGFGEVTKDIFK
jgi:hypothetical protein